MAIKKVFNPFTKKLDKINEQNATEVPYSGSVPSVSDVSAALDALQGQNTAQDVAISGKANASHTHALSDLTQSGALTNYSIQWNGTNWVPVRMASMTLTGSGQSIPSGVDTLITFSFFGINEAGISYSAGTMTLADIGRYRAYLQVSYDDASSTNIVRQLAIRLNGGNIRLTRNDDNNGGTSALRSYQIEAVFDTSATNATLEFYVQQNTGSSVTLVNNELTHAHISRIR